jgi:hypothetical protein
MRLDKCSTLAGVVAAALLVAGSAACGKESWPMVHGVWPPDLDTTRLVTIPGDSATLFRTEAMVVFRDSVSDAAKRAFVARENLKILGVTPEGFLFVRFADPGPVIEAYWAALANLRRQPEVLRALALFRSGLKEVGLAPDEWSPSSTSVHPSGQAGDTSRPAVPPTDSWPADPRLVPTPWDTAEVYYADVVGILFDESAGGARVRSVLQRYGATIFGGSQPPLGTGEYFVRIPALDGSWAALDSVTAALNDEPGVQRATGLSYRLRIYLR